MTKSTHRTSDRQEVSEQHALDASGCIKDGFTVRGSLAMMDSAGIMHTPGFARMDDSDMATREAAREQRKRQLSDAWRTPGSQDGALETAPATREQAYAAYNKRLQDAWKGGAP